MIALPCAGQAKTVIQGFYGTYTSHSDSDKFALILERNYANFGSQGMDDTTMVRSSRSLEIQSRIANSK